MDLDSLLQQMQSLQLQIKENIHRMQEGTKEVVFLVYKASCWPAMESVWKAAAADPDYTVYVVPVPWYYRNTDGTLQSQPQCEGSLLPEYVPVTPHTDYDLEVRHPHIIIFQNPYDQYNFTTSVDPQYYSYALKTNSENLVYIPWFATDEIDFNDPEDGKAVYNMRYYVTVPGVVHADMTIVQSEQMRQTYIEVLSQFAGDQTRAHWENKIFGFGSPIFEKGSPQQESQIWEKLKAQVGLNTQKEENDEIR